MKHLILLFSVMMLSITTTLQVTSVKTFYFEPLSLVSQFEGFGHRINNLLIKIENGNTSRLQGDLETGAIDIMDEALPQSIIEKWSKAPYNETIAMEKHPTAYMYELDLNCNETLLGESWRSPTSYVEFRHAIAHLVDKERIIDEVLKGCGMEMSTPVMPWSEWFNDGADTHPYDPVEAATILDAAGFVQGSTPNPYYNASNPGSTPFIRVYPPGHEKAGQDLDPLIFYVRYDLGAREAAGFMIRDQLLSLGIPVVVPVPVRGGIDEDNVWIYHKYNLYTGAWILSAEPDYLYDLYDSKNYGPGYAFSNLNNVHDDELDHWLETLFTAPSKDVALTACFEAQRRLAEIVGVVPIWCPVEVNAYRKTSDRAPAGWTGFVNQQDCGTGCWWTFLNVHQNDSEQGGTVDYGVFSYVDSLNPIDYDWLAEGEILTEIYDSLLNRNPNSFGLVPDLAKSFEVGTWFDSESGANCTKITFHLDDDVYWHDGALFTSNDVKFTIDYLLQFALAPPPTPWEYYLVSNVKSVEAPDPYMVTVYMKVQSYWELYKIGGLLMIPEHIWEGISTQDALGSMPDPNLIGTGPFKLVEYLPETQCLLEANPNYFKYCPVQIEVSFSSRHVNPEESIYFDVTISNCFADKELNMTVTIFFDDSLIENRTVNLAPNTTMLFGHYDSGALDYGLHELKILHNPDEYVGRTCTYQANLLVDCPGGGAGGRVPLAT